MPARATSALHGAHVRFVKATLLTLLAVATQLAGRHGSEETSLQLLRRTRPNRRAAACARHPISAQLLTISGLYGLQQFVQPRPVRTWRARPSATTLRGRIILPHRSCSRRAFARQSGDKTKLSVSRPARRDVKGVPDLLCGRRPAPESFPQHLTRTCASAQPCAPLRDYDEPLLA